MRSGLGKSEMDNVVSAPLTLDQKKAFIAACTAGDLSKAQHFIELGIDVDITLEGGNSGLFIVVSANKPQMVNLLLQNGANPNQERSDGFTPLSCAMIEKNRSCADLLLEKLAHPISTQDKHACVEIASGKITDDTLDGAYRYNQALMLVAPNAADFKQSFAFYAALRGDLRNANQYFLEALRLRRTSSCLVEYANFLIQQRYGLEANRITDFAEPYLVEARSLEDDSALYYSSLDSPMLDRVLSVEIEHVEGEISLTPWVLATWLLIQLRYEQGQYKLILPMLDELIQYSIRHLEDVIARVFLMHACYLVGRPDIALLILSTINYFDVPSTDNFFDTQALLSDSSPASISPTMTTVGLFSAPQSMSSLATQIIETQKQIPKVGQVRLIFKTESAAKICQQQLQVAAQSSMASAAASSITVYVVEPITIIDDQQTVDSAASTVQAVLKAYSILLTQADYNKFLSDSGAYDELLENLSVTSRRSF